MRSLIWLYAVALPSVANSFLLPRAHNAQDMIVLKGVLQEQVISPPANLISNTRFTVREQNDTICDARGRWNLLVPLELALSTSRSPTPFLQTFCFSDPDISLVKHWTGTVDVSDEKTLFFWFFESRSTPSTDPVIIWMNGGLGGASMMGLFREIGPCLVVDGDDESTKYNAYSWSNFANMLYIELVPFCLTC